MINFTKRGFTFSAKQSSRRVAPHFLNVHRALKFNAIGSRLKGRFSKRFERVAERQHRCGPLQLSLQLPHVSSRRCLPMQDRAAAPARCWLRRQRCGRRSTRPGQGGAKDAFPEAAEQRAWQDPARSEASCARRRAGLRPAASCFFSPRPLGSFRSHARTGLLCSKAQGGRRSQQFASDLAPRLWLSFYELQGPTKFHKISKRTYVNIRAPHEPCTIPRKLRLRIPLESIGINGKSKHCSES